MSARIIPVLLCGGGGTRLWPVSTAGRPKQLLALAAEATMLQQTASRVSGPSFEPAFVVAGLDLADEIEAQLAAVGAAAAKIILEPCARNTAPAIVLAALQASPDAILLVMPSDHVIGDVDAFLAAVATGVPPAQDDWLVTFGIRPTRPETGYGYIRTGAELSAGALRVERFLEKPDREVAEALLSEGGYVWNAGIFLFRAGAFLDAVRQAAPDVVSAAAAALASGRVDGRRLYADATAFAAAPSISIDHAVMEKAKRVAIVPFEAGWSDVGSWEALDELSAKDGDGNSLRGEVVALDCSGCFIRSEGPAVIAIGVHDLVVAATPDGVLVMPKADSQRVREALALLEAKPEKPK